MTYNGYKNYETWSLVNWIFRHDKLLELCNKAVNAGFDIEGLHQLILEKINERRMGMPFGEMLGDVVDSHLKDIDWQGIYKTFIE